MTRRSLEAEDMTRITKAPLPALRKSFPNRPWVPPRRQAGLRGACQEAIARRAPHPDAELTPGDRVAGLGNFGKPTGVPAPSSEPMKTMRSSGGMAMAARDSDNRGSRRFSHRQGSPIL